MARLEGTVLHDELGYQGCQVYFDQVHGLHPGERLVAYPADECVSPHAEEQRFRELSHQCFGAYGPRAPRVVWTGTHYVAFVCDEPDVSAPAASGETRVEALEALLARLQAAPKPVGEMSEADKLRELSEAGWEVKSVSVQDEDRVRLLISHRCRDVQESFAYINLNGALGYAIHAVRKLRKEACSP